MKIKICGLRRPEDVKYANEVKPDYIGFILSEGFRRSIPLETAKRLKNQLDPSIMAVGVFVNESPEYVAKCLEDGIIDVAQLHGHESEEDVLYVKAKTGKPVIKVVKVVDRYIVEAWLDSSADYLLFDSGTGTGKTFDWSVLQEVLRDFGGSLPKEFFLAGGITAELIDQAHENIRPFAVDVSSGVETDGVKDLEKMKLAVSAVRKYHE